MARRGILVGAVAAGLLAVNAAGLQYYMASQAERMRHPLRPYFKPSGLVGQTRDIRFTSKLVDGRFPEYSRVIPAKPGMIITAGREELRQALQRAAILSNEKYRGIRFSGNANTLTIQAHNPEQEEAEEQLEVVYDGPELDIGFNDNYLLSALEAIDGDEVDLAGPHLEAERAILAVLAAVVDAGQQLQGAEAGCGEGIDGQDGVVRAVVCVEVELAGLLDDIGEPLGTAAQDGAVVGFAGLGGGPGGVENLGPAVTAGESPHGHTRAGGFQPGMCCLC